MYFKTKEEQRVKYKRGRRCELHHIQKVQSETNRKLQVVSGKHVARQHQMVICRITLETISES